MGEVRDEVSAVFCKTDKTINPFTVVGVGQFGIAAIFSGTGFTPSELTTSLRWVTSSFSR